MWLIFLLSAMSIALCMLAIVYIANKVFIAMKKDQVKRERELKQENLEEKDNG